MAAGTSLGQSEAVNNGMEDVNWSLFTGSNLVSYSGYHFYEGGTLPLRRGHSNRILSNANGSTMAYNDIAARRGK